MKIITVIAFTLLVFVEHSVAAGLATEMRYPGSFHALNLGTDVDLHYRPGKHPSLKMSAPKALLAQLKTYVKNGELFVQWSAPISNSGPIHIEATGPTLDSIVLASAGRISAQDIKGDEVQVVITGSGDVKLAGEAHELVVNMTGSGNLDAGKLASKKINIDLFGSGHILASASEYAYVHNMASGSVQVTGNPTDRKVEKHGSGEVLFK